jgi:hypothetical protein
VATVEKSLMVTSACAGILVRRPTRRPFLSRERRPARVSSSTLVYKEVEEADRLRLAAAGRPDQEQPERILVGEGLRRGGRERGEDELLLAGGDVEVAADGLDDVRDAARGEDAFELLLGGGHATLPPCRRAFRVRRSARSARTAAASG